MVGGAAEEAGRAERQRREALFTQAMLNVTVGELLAALTAVMLLLVWRVSLDASAGV